MIRQLADLKERNVLIQQLNSQQLVCIGTLSRSFLQQNADVALQQSKCRALSGPINEIAGFISDAKVSSAKK
jgi:hypothetical protein